MQEDTGGFRALADPMKLVPEMVGVIECRLLVNYRVDPDVLQRFLPEPFRPHLVDGAGVAGICLIRLGQLRPGGVPRRLGLTVENAAHRVAVEWDGPDGPGCGVYVPRRDTSSNLATLVGGRLSPASSTGLGSESTNTTAASRSPSRAVTAERMST